MQKLGKLLLCGIEFSVNLGTASERDALDDSYGYCDHERHEIWARQSLSNTALADTLLHEMLHAIFENSGCAQFLHGALPDGADAKAVEETMIRILTPHLRVGLSQLKRLKV